MKILFAVCALMAVSTTSFAGKLTDIARNADGSVRLMSQQDADSYCRNQSQRLPTARELALYAQSLGAQGIGETPKYGYTLVPGSDSTGKPDDFYFCADGYRRPDGDLGENWFWSSSVDPDASYIGYILAGDGRISVGLIDVGKFGLWDASLGAVRCVRSR